MTMWQAILQVSKTQEGFGYLFQWIVPIILCVGVIIFLKYTMIATILSIVFALVSLEGARQFGLMAITYKNAYNKKNH